MVKALLGKKLGMTQVYAEDGTIVPVTVLQVGPCRVTQVRTPEVDGYSAVQIGFGAKKRKRTNKPMLGHLEKSKSPPMRILKEVALEEGAEVEPGQDLTVEVFEGQKLVDVAGTTKGKGFQGVMTRWGFAGGPATHGSTRHRAPGSIGAGTSPGHTLKGARMAGHTGNRRRTTRNLQVVRIDKDRDLMLVKGAVPGHKGGYVIVRKAVAARSAAQ